MNSNWWKRELITWGIMILMFITGWVFATARHSGDAAMAEFYKAEYQKTQADLQVVHFDLMDGRLRNAKERTEQAAVQKQLEFYMQRNADGTNKLKMDYVQLQSEYLLLRTSIPQKLCPILPTAPDWYTDMLKIYNQRLKEKEDMDDLLKTLQSPPHTEDKDRQIEFYKIFNSRLVTWDYLLDRNYSFWHLAEILARTFPAPMQMPKHAD